MAVSIPRRLQWDLFVFQLPSVGTWFKVCAALYDFFMIEQSEAQDESFLLNAAKSKLNINVRFSER